MKGCQRPSLPCSTGSSLSRWDCLAPAPLRQAPASSYRRRSAGSASPAPRHRRWPDRSGRCRPSPCCRCRRRRRRSCQCRPAGPCSSRCTSRSRQRRVCHRCRCRRSHKLTVGSSVSVTVTPVSVCVAGVRNRDRVGDHVPGRIRHERAVPARASLTMVSAGVCATGTETSAVSGPVWSLSAVAVLSMSPSPPPFVSMSLCWTV